jgi:fucose 4-O-acetylase-like acetyltransferase
VKAAAIVAVVFNHAGGGGFAPQTDTLDFLLTSLWTRFHVPSFLFVSGLLYARSQPAGLRQVGERLARVLLPYLIASCVAQLAGVTTARSAGDVVFQLATASSLGIYYYVFVIAVCTPLVWPLSRVSARAVAALVLACFSLSVAYAVDPSLRFAQSFFWAMRDPLQHFYLGYFASGWLVAGLLPRLRPSLGAFALALSAAGLGLASFAELAPLAAPFDRMLYTFGVIALVSLATRRRPARGAARFLSEATLGLYLYHRIFQNLALPWTRELAELPRILAQVAAGLAGASLVVLAGRRLLGRERARRYLGG